MVPPCKPCMAHGYGVHTLGIVARLAAWQRFILAATARTDRPDRHYPEKTLRQLGSWASGQLSTDV